MSGVDIAKLDAITLSDASIQLVTKLLTDLNVMESTLEEEKKEATVSEKEDVQEDDAIFDEQARFAAMQEEEEEDVDDDAIFDEQQRFAVTSGYAEYEDDVEEDYLDGEPVNQGGATTALENESYNDVVENDSDDDNDEIRESPLFLHLTTQLSFSEAHVERACRAIENWQVPTANTSKDDTVKSNNALLDNDELALAMDWLCLHLTDNELEAGFRPNPKSMDRKPMTSSGKTGIILAGTGRTRPIPHSSISVARPITSDQEWRETLKRQSRKVGFFRLGFHHSEAEKACDETTHVSEKLSTEEDEDGLRVMLSLLEKETLGDALVDEEPSNQTDFDFAASEREQEVEALEAIFDEQFQVRQRQDQKAGFERYLLTVTPVEDLQRPGHSDECRLHVFVRPGYPVLSPPLLLFTNPTLPPTLLRRINVSLIQHAHESVGEPIIFAAMDFLSNNIHEMQIDFIKEQRAKEMEAEQLRMRQEAGHDIDAILEAQYENDGKLGRRQKAKLRAAEKSFNHSEQMQQIVQERLRKQEERLKRIKSEQGSVRAKRAERAIEEREKARIDEEAERAARAAMSAAFNRGESTDEARAAAKKARKNCIRENGGEVSSSEDEDDIDTTPPAASASDETDAPDASLEEEDGDDDEAADRPTLLDEKQPGLASKSTPATMAFMERLRKCYNDAVLEKIKHERTEESVMKRHGETKQNEDDVTETGNYHFTRPSNVKEQDHKDTAVSENSNGHLPSPVPVPTGALADVMKDVIQSQNEQPWLISSEARAPTVKVEEAELMPEQLRQRDEVSKKLKDELIGKHKAADSFAKKTAVGARTNGMGGKPQQFYRMRSQRERFVLIISSSYCCHSFLTLWCCFIN